MPEPVKHRYECPQGHSDWRPRPECGASLVHCEHDGEVMAEGLAAGYEAPAADPLAEKFAAMTRAERLEWMHRYPAVRPEDVPASWIQAAEDNYSMHGQGLLRNILAGVAPLIRADERARIRSLLPYNVNCCESFPAAVADLIGEHGDD